MTRITGVLAASETAAECIVCGASWKGVKAAEDGYAHATRAGHDVHITATTRYRAASVLAERGAA